MRHAVSEPVTLISVIGYELKSNTELGVGTQKACDEAVKIAREVGSAARILTTATTAGAKYRRVNMGRLMLEYIQQQAPEIEAGYEEAKSFDSVGEVRATAKVAKYNRTLIPSERIGRIIFVVKWFHAPRIWMLALLILPWCGVEERRTVKPHWLPVTPRALLHEAGGLVENWFRVRAMKNAKTC